MVHQKHQQSNRNAAESSTHSHHRNKKRKHFYTEERHEEVVACTRNHTSSTYKRFQSSSFNLHSFTNVPRKWTYSPRHFSGFEDRVVLVSYNILGVKNASAHPDLYVGILPKYMDWDHRKAVICKELSQYNPNILCFQEVDRFSDLQNMLQQDGFEGVLKARTGDACDGCAIFWDRKRFVLLQEDYIEFQSFGMRNNVAQFCVLKTVDECRSLVVGNIHVLYNPKRGDIKLGQVRLFLEKARSLSEEWGGIPIVLAGDLNSAPESAVYQYISSGKLDVLQHDRKTLSGLRGTFHFGLKSQRPLHVWTDEELKYATGSEGITCLQHSLKLHSAYLGIPGNFTTRDNSGEPLGTVCHSKNMETVDYIWHSAGLVPVRVLETLPRIMLGKLGGLPSESWGSDHLALVCDFAFGNDES